MNFLPVLSCGVGEEEVVSKPFSYFCSWHIIWGILNCSFFTQCVKKSICYKCYFKMKYIKIEFLKIRVHCRSYGRNQFLKLVSLSINKSIHVPCGHIKCMSSMQHWLFLSFAWNAPLPSCDLRSNAAPSQDVVEVHPVLFISVACLLPLLFCRFQGSFFFFMVYNLFFLFWKFIYLFLFSYNCMPFLPIPPPHPSRTTSLPHLCPPPWFCPCVLSSSSCRPLSPLLMLLASAELLCPFSSLAPNCSLPICAV